MLTNKINMKLGFSTLALFMSSLEDCLETATIDGFQLMEILCEGPYWPRNILDSQINFEIFESYDITVYLHSPTIDLNPGSLNPGIREETLKQLKETVDLAVETDSEAITTHPGLIHRLEERVRNFGIKHSIEILTMANDYAVERGIKFSIENMPNRYAYFCNTSEEHEYFVRECGSYATLDTGHANTSDDVKSFFKIKNIVYYHLNDNNGEKDQHLPLGEGTLDLSLLDGVHNGIIELNNYQNILKSRDLIKSSFV